jgi:hypothetical protein
MGDQGMKRFKVVAIPNGSDALRTFVFEVRGSGVDNTFAQQERVAKLCEAALNAADDYSIDAAK